MNGKPEIFLRFLLICCYAARMTFLETDGIETMGDSDMGEMDEADELSSEENGKLEDIDVLCSRHTESGERLWTWLDVSDYDVRGHWREYGACVDKTDYSPRFRFQAFELNDSSVYEKLNEHCRRDEYDYAQPARLNPRGSISTYGWPERNFYGIHGPPSFHLGSGRPDTLRSRRKQLSTEGWFVFQIDQDVFTKGWLSVRPCRQVRLMNEYFGFDDIPCSDYRKCV